MIDRRRKGQHGFRRVPKKSSPLRMVLLLFIWIPLTLLIVLVASGAGFLGFYGAMVYRARVATVKLDNLIGMSSVEATRRLREAGLTVEVVGDHGTVIRMDPLPGTVVKVGRRVRLYTEKVRAKYMFLPDFSGVWYRTVLQILRDAGVRYSVSEVDGDAFKGVVLWTVPTSGAKVYSGDLVRLSVSSGRRVNEEQEDQADTPESTSVDAPAPVPESAESQTSPTHASEGSWSGEPWYPGSPDGDQSSPPVPELPSNLGGADGWQAPEETQHSPGDEHYPSEDEHNTNESQGGQF